MDSAALARVYDGFPSSGSAEPPCVEVEAMIPARALARLRLTPTGAARRWSWRRAAEVGLAVRAGAATPLAGRTGRRAKRGRGRRATAGTPRLALIAAALLASSAPAIAQQPPGEVPPSAPPTGWYGGLGFKVATPTFERAFQRKLGFNVSTNETIGIDGRVGYRLHPNFAAEFQVEWLNPFKADVGVQCSSPFEPTAQEINQKFPGGVGAPDPRDFPNFPCRGRELVFPETDPVRNGDPFRIEPVVMTLNGRAYLTTSRLQPYLTFGSGLIHVDIRDKAPNGQDVKDLGFALRVGGGFEYAITEQIVLTLGASYVVPLSGRAQDFDYVSFEPFGLTWRFATPGP